MMDQENRMLKKQGGQEARRLTKNLPQGIKRNKIKLSNQAYIIDAAIHETSVKLLILTRQKMELESKTKLIRVK